MCGRKRLKSFVEQLPPGPPIFLPLWGAAPAISTTLRTNLIDAKSWWIRLSNKIQWNPVKCWWPAGTGDLRCTITWSPRGPWVCTEPVSSCHTLDPQVCLHQGCSCTTTFQKIGLKPKLSVGSPFMLACLLLPCAKLEQTNWQIWTSLISRYCQSPECIKRP